MSHAEASTSHKLVGLDAANPLAFLAALGTLRLLDHAARDSVGTPRLRWTEAANGWQPVLTLENRLAPPEIAELLRQSLATDFDGETGPEYCYGEVIKTEPGSFRDTAQAVLEQSHPDFRHAADFLASFASDAVEKEANRKRTGVVQETTLSFANGQGGQCLLKHYRTMALELVEEQIQRALFEPWRYIDDRPTFRWDPHDQRLYARQARSPQSETSRTVRGANALAFWGMGVLTAVPQSNNTLRTMGFARLSDGNGRQRDHLTWPVWEAPVTLDVVRGLLAHPQLVDDPPDRPELRAIGCPAVFRSQKVIDDKGNAYFSPARSV